MYIFSAPDFRDRPTARARATASKLPTPKRGEKFFPRSWSAAVGDEKLVGGGRSAACALTHLGSRKLLRRRDFFFFVPLTAHRRRRSPRVCSLGSGRGAGSDGARPRRLAASERQLPAQAASGYATVRCSEAGQRSSPTGCDGESNNECGPVGFGSGASASGSKRVILAKTVAATTATEAEAEATEVAKKVFRRRRRRRRISFAAVAQVARRHSHRLLARSLGARSVRAREYFFREASRKIK